VLRLPDVTLTLETVLTEEQARLVKDLFASLARGGGAS